MERKLVKQGRGALTVTLPAKWLAERGLSAGNTISFEEENNFLIIRSSGARVQEKITLDLRYTKRKSLFFHIIHGKYVEGYDEIEILHSNVDMLLDIPQQLLGFIILEHNSKRTILKNMLVVPDENFTILLRRAGHQLVEHAKTLQEVALKNISEKEFHRRERVLDFHLLYCMRYLNKYSDVKHSYRSFLLCATFEALADQLQYIAQAEGFNLDVAKEISIIIEKYILFLFTHDFDRLYIELRKFRDACLKKTYLDGLVYSLAEMLYNNIGYLVEEKK